jgi:hypothetical protein
VVDVWKVSHVHKPYKIILEIKVIGRGLECEMGQWKYLEVNTKMEQTVDTSGERPPLTHVRSYISTSDCKWQPKVGELGWFYPIYIFFIILYEMS